MSLGSAFRQIVESMPEYQQKEYKERIMTKVINQFSEVIKKQENDILNGIGDLISRLYNHTDSIIYTGVSEHDTCDLVLEAATTIDILAERVIDEQSKADVEYQLLNSQLRTKQAYIEYLEKRLDDSSVGFVKILEVYAKSN